MPIKNTIKSYLKNGYYHIYNRGVEKRKIFQDGQDYAVFLSYLKEYLVPKDEKLLESIIADPNAGWREKSRAIQHLKLNNFFGEIILMAYCLMPNHFHFLLKQKSDMAIDKFLNSLGTRFTMFVNSKYERVGPLCQSEYKAVLIESDEQLLYTSGYIHRNFKPKALALKGVALRSWIYKQPSSLPEYLGLRKTEWVHPEEILKYFSQNNPNLDYQSFVEQTDDYSIVSKALIDK